MHRTHHIVAVAALLASASAEAVTATPRWASQLRPATVLEGEPQRTFRLSERMARYRVPAISVAVIDQCRITETYFTGSRTQGGPAITARTRFQAASISKAVTAGAALRGVERGKLSLDADLRESIRGWTATGPGAGAPLSLRQLLSHSGGINVHGFEGYGNGRPVPSTKQVLLGEPPANNKPVVMDAVPGKEFRYSGGGYMLVQALLTERMGMEFEALVEDQLFKPVRMRDSSFRAPRNPRIVAVGHDQGGLPVKGAWNVYPELAAAGLWSTPTDLAKFAIAIMRSSRAGSNTLLRQATAREMLTTQSPGPWGLGFEIRRKGDQPIFMHSGENAGYLAVLVGIPATCSGVVVMTNGDGGAGLMKEVVQSISREKQWPQAIEPIQLKPLDDAQAGRIVGRYLVDAPSIKFEIIRSADTLGLLLADGRKGRILRDSAGRIVVVDPDLNPLAALNPSPDGTLALSLGGRTLIARRSE